MKKFMDKDFLLSSDPASALFHSYAEKLPIIDYHCHVSPAEIAQDKRYSNITELWLSGDHYKWRAIRSNGIDEKYVTGDASDYEKFAAYAKTMPRLIGNPLYHWTHLELQRYFDCDLILSEKTVDEIWELTSEKLASPDMSVRGLIKKSNVELLCTTDDPADSLEHHAAIAKDDTFSTQVLPAFRPDKGMNIERKGIADYIAKLSEAAGVKITDLESLKDAYIKRLDHFESLGCRTADHGYDDYVKFVKPNSHMADEAFMKALETDGKGISEEEAALYKCEMMRFFGAEYAKRGWVMQVHFGVMRNPNSVQFARLGPDTGYDTIGGEACIMDLAKMLDMLNSDGALPRTILYSINPCDNAAIGTLIGSFQYADGSGMPRIHQGSAWWFNDNNDGMRAQMKSLANLSVFGNFLGMLTDSRSFTSYPRHEYFRRILCDVIGGWVENGEYPADVETLGQLVCDICYNNTKDFFGFKI